MLGAGGVGGGVGALLQGAGYDVTLVARGAHLEAMRRHGLRLLTPEGARTLAMPVAARVPDGADIILLAVQSQDTLTALSGVARAVPVVSLQNGVDNEPRIAALGHPVIGAMVWVPAVHLEPGEVRLHGAPTPGAIDVGDWPHGAGTLAHTVRALLTAAGFESACREDIMAWKRGKLLTNLAGGLQAACGAVPEDLLSRVVAEAEAAFAAAGWTWVRFDEVMARSAIDSLPAGGHDRPGGSMWQTVARGRPTEAHHLHGEVVRLAERCGLDAPLNRQLLQISDMLSTPGAWTPEALRAALNEAERSLHEGPRRA